jgi:hypothetical protein
MEEFESSKTPGTDMPLDSQSRMFKPDPDNLPPVPLPKSGYKEVKNSRLPPNEMHDRFKRANGDDSPRSPTFEVEFGVKGDQSPARKTSDVKDFPEVSNSLSDEDAPSPKNPIAMSMRDPSDSAKERSKAFNIFFGLSFASGGFYFGYSLAMLSPLGEKWLKYNFDIIENSGFYLGMANLLVAIGVGIGSTVSSILCEKYGRVPLLFYSEITMMFVHSFMWVHNIWLFLV